MHPWWALRACIQPCSFVCSEDGLRWTLDNPLMPQQPAPLGPPMHCFRLCFIQINTYYTLLKLLLLVLCA